MLQNNYRIMIVDDEPDMREGIVQCVPWQQIGYEVAAEAENGKDALEKLENNEIDVVLTDIKMPFMDGLTMAREVNRLYPGVKIIILSGFDEFAYAKEAVSLNIAEYVLKPINAAELSEVLTRLHKTLDDETDRQRNIELLTESYKRTLPLLQERFLIELLWGTVPEDKANRLMEQYDSPLRKAENSIVTVFQVKQAAGGAAISEELVPLSIADMLKDKMQDVCAFQIVQASAMVVVIAAWNEPTPFDRMLILANEICERCRKVLGAVVSAGVGRSCQKASEIHRSFVQAQRALEYWEVAGKGKAIYIGDMERNRVGKGHLDSRGEEYFLNLLKFGTSEQIEQMVQEVSAQLADADALERQAYMTGVFHSLYRLSQYYNFQANEEIQDRMQWFLSASEQWANLTAMSEWLRHICTLVRAEICENRKSSTRTLADTATRYMNQHYADSTLSVEQMCEHLHLSQSYFSTVFKQETGQSFVRSLTEVRMNRAVELLESTDEKTYQIAAQVGYDEPNYFSYVFKKFFGTSPTKYRARWKESHE